MKIEEGGEESKGARRVVATRCSRPEEVVAEERERKEERQAGRGREGEQERRVASGPARFVHLTREIRV